MLSIYSIQKMYEETSDRCPGRQVLIGCFVWCGQVTIMDDIVGRAGREVNLPHQFLMDLFENLMCRRVHPRYGLLDEESYHEDGERKEG